MQEFSGKVAAIEDYYVGGKLDAQAMTVEADVDYLPGQYFMLSHGDFKLRTDPEKLKWTSYSVATSPLQKGFLEFVYTIKPTGGFTQFLGENLKPGMSINLRGPLGKFVLQENQKSKVFVATGAGISPLLGMIRTLQLKGFPVGARLFYGFKTGEHFLCRAQLEELLSPKFRMKTIISREDRAWVGERGHVQDLLSKEEFSPGKEEVYVCGSPAMITDIKNLFASKGIPPEDIRMELW